MSFYEIVFGVLFVGAARLVFLFVIDTPDLAGFFSAAMVVSQSKSALARQNDPNKSWSISRVL